MTGVLKMIRLNKEVKKDFTPLETCEIGHRRGLRKVSHIDLPAKCRRKKSLTGFTLLEVLAASVIILVVAAVTSQLLSYPKAKLITLEQKVMMIEHLDEELKNFSSTVPYPVAATIACSHPNSCNANICGSVCSDIFGAGNLCDGVLTNDNLTAIVDAYPSMCYARAVVDPTCDPIGNENATQVCASAEWYGGLNSGNQPVTKHGAITTFVFRP